jgi:[acyl-carrier-protein] S-malonyltransferase
MNSFAMLFPGQGSQYINMLSSFFQKKDNIFKKIFDEASEYINYNLLKLIQNRETKKRDNYKKKMGDVQHLCQDIVWENIQH